MSDSIYTAQEQRIVKIFAAFLMQADRTNGLRHDPVADQVDQLKMLARLTATGQAKLVRGRPQAHLGMQPRGPGQGPAMKLG